MNLFKGRINRTTYLLANLVAVLFAILLNRPDISQYLDDHEIVTLVVAFGVAIPLIVWQLGAAARRLHDRDLSGWWSLLIVFPVVQVVLMIVPGTKGTNQFGRAPKQLFDLHSLFTS